VEEEPVARPEQPAPWWKCVVAALPAIATAAQFYAMAGASRQPLFGAGRETLTRIMQVEFLVIHSMAFLGLVALWKPGDAAGRRTRAVLFWGLAGLYCLAAGSRGGESLLVFLGLSFVTYLGLFLNWHSPSAMVQLGARWLVGTALFLIALGVFGAPKNAGEWLGRQSVIKAGTLYFASLALLELAGFFQRRVPRWAPGILKALRESKTRGR
jgi:hypothetical protein